MKNVLIVVFIICFGLASWFAFGLYGDVMLRKHYKEDIAEINRVNYELFNAELWKREALDIFETKIKEFEISNEMYGFLDDQVQAYLNTMYERYIESGELVEMIFQQLEDSGTANKMFLNIIKKNVSAQIGQMDLRKQIPGLSKQVIDEIKLDEPLIKSYMQAELLRLVLDDSSREMVDRRYLIYNKYLMNDLADTEAYLNTQIANYDSKISTNTKYSLFGLGFLLIISILIYRQSYELATGGLTLISILLLILGVSLPMIDIDARLDSFVFDLLGEPISFDEQVIYFQSKSIVEVTKTLWLSGGVDLKAVGTLLLLFSIVFPFFKLLLSAGYLFIHSFRLNRVVQNIIFHLGKWSMADVFVVAIFMAYIGMYGIITSQLSSIDQNDGGLIVETLNYSQLSLGAFFFTTYTILSIIIGIIINRRSITDADV